MHRVDGIVRTDDTETGVLRAWRFRLLHDTGSACQVSMSSHTATVVLTMTCPCERMMTEFSSAFIRERSGLPSCETDRRHTDCPSEYVCVARHTR